MRRKVWVAVSVVSWIVFEDCAAELEFHDLLRGDGFGAFVLLYVGQLIEHLVLKLDKRGSRSRRTPPSKSLPVALPAFSKVLFSQKSHRLLRRLAPVRF